MQLVRLQQLHSIPVWTQATSAAWKLSVLLFFTSLSCLFFFLHQCSESRAGTLFPPIKIHFMQKVRKNSKTTKQIKTAKNTHRSIIFFPRKYHYPKNFSPKKISPIIFFLFTYTVFLTFDLHHPYCFSSMKLVVSLRVRLESFVFWWATLCLFLPLQSDDPLVGAFILKLPGIWRHWSTTKGGEQWLSIYFRGCSIINDCPLRHPPRALVLLYFENPQCVTSSWCLQFVHVCLVFTVCISMFDTIENDMTCDAFNVSDVKSCK